MLTLHYVPSCAAGRGCMQRTPCGHMLVVFEPHRDHQEYGQEGLRCHCRGPHHTHNRTITCANRGERMPNPRSLHPGRAAALNCASSTSFLINELPHQRASSSTSFLIKAGASSSSSTSFLIKAGATYHILPYPHPGCNPIRQASGQALLDDVLLVCVPCPVRP